MADCADEGLAEDEDPLHTILRRLLIYTPTYHQTPLARPSRYKIINNYEKDTHVAGGTAGNSYNRVSAG